MCICGAPFRDHILSRPICFEEIYTIGMHRGYMLWVWGRHIVKKKHYMQVAIVISYSAFH